MNLLKKAFMKEALTAFVRQYQGLKNAYDHEALILKCRVVFRLLAKDEDLMKDT